MENDCGASAVLRGIKDGERNTRRADFPERHIGVIHVALIEPAAFFVAGDLVGERHVRSF